MERMQRGVEESINSESQGERSSWCIFTQVEHKETFYVCVCTVSAIWLEKGI